MQNKFGMDKIQWSHKLEWLYVLFPVRIYFTSSKKVINIINAIMLITTTRPESYTVQKQL